MILATEHSNSLSAFFVWTPELGATEANVPGGLALVPDKRARHYWNPTESLGQAYERILPTPEAAWDVYLLFRRGVRWSASSPPKPDFWMHQLGGVTTAPRLDPEVLRSQVERLLLE